MSCFVYVPTLWLTDCPNPDQCAMPAVTDGMIYVCRMLVWILCYLVLIETKVQLIKIIHIMKDLIPIDDLC